MNGAHRWGDYLTLNVLFLGLAVVAQTNGLVLPLLVQKFVGEEMQGTYLGRLRLATLMTAVLWQALSGALSDHSRSRWGRRRPFILAGALGAMLGMAAIGLSSSAAGMAGYWLAFGAALLVSIGANTAQGAQQGLMPDLAPEARRERLSAVKAVLELPVPLMLIALTVAPAIAAGDLGAALAIAGAALMLTTLITMRVQEQPLIDQPERLDWTPLLRLIGMTGAFTVVIVGSGQLVRLASTLLNAVRSPAVLLPLMGGVGLLAMAGAVALGVRIGVGLGIGGDAARRNRPFVWWVANRLAFLVGTTNLAVFAVYFLQARLQLAGARAAGPAALLLAVIGACILLSAMATGWLARGFRHEQLLAAGGIMAAAGVLVVLSSARLAVIVAGGAVIGSAAGIFFTASWALGARLAPPAEAGRYLGIANLAGAGAGAVGAYIGGPVADYITTRLPDMPGAGYVLLFAVYGLMFLLSVALLKGVRL